MLPFPLASHLEFGNKAGELLMPVVECGRRRDDQEWTPDVVSLCGNRKIRIHCQSPQQVVFWYVNASAPKNRKPQRDSTTGAFLSVIKAKTLTFPLYSSQTKRINEKIELKNSNSCRDQRVRGGELGKTAGAQKYG